ncbi:MAG: ribonuclease III, partial [Gammaproteobacteria bacterium]|nr:ribonuclease III [Gammaproteobacteria bacterium]
MRQPLDRLSQVIDYDFVDKALIEKALTHRSVGNDNNERLEFLGDAILGFVIAETLYRQFPGADEGQLSRLRARLVKGETLAELASQIELGGYLSLGPGESRSGGHARTSILSDALEAMFAAVYLDGGHEPVRRIIHALYQQKLSSL